jgi:diguanylate cyclase (GGDEF)-like protein
MKHTLFVALLAGVLCGVAPTNAAHAATEPSVTFSAAAARDKLDAISRNAAADPATAAARLVELATEGSAVQRAMAAWALAAAYRELSDDTATAALVWRLERSASALDRAVAALVRARVARDDAAPDLAVREAREALQRLDQALATMTPGLLEDTLRADLLRLLGAVTGATGQVEDGLRQLQGSRRLAQALRDPTREALALNDEADVLAQYGQAERAMAAQAEAWRAAQTVVPPDAALLARLQAGAARRVLAAAHDATAWAAAGAAAQSALASARLARAGALEAEALLLLSQAERLAGEPAAAQRAARAALSAAAGLPATAPLKRMALAQMGLAQIAAGQAMQGKQAVESVLVRNGAAGSDPLAAALLRQLDEALRTVGEPRAALEVFHRERALQQARLENERSVVLRDLQTRHDRERQQRELDTLNHGNTLKAAALEQRELMQRGLWAAAVLVMLGIIVMVLLYRRLRALRKRLAASQARLKDFSERDALTGLANRRHCQAVIAGGGLEAAFEGALLLLDIDHFKRINDQHGHAVGDAVLIEVARRLNQTVRGDDLIVRWGGEEFLVVSLRLPAQRLPLLAERLRLAVAGVPIDSPAGPLTVTLSIGHAHFPLQGEPALGWERAVDRVDAALYAAKAQGRNRACAVEPIGDDALRRINARSMAAATA